MIKPNKDVLPNVLQSKTPKFASGPKPTLKNLNKIAVLVAEHFHVRISKSTLKRLLKSMAFSWRRVRKGLKGEPDPEEYQQKQQALHDLQQQASQGILDLYYFDE